MRRRSKWLIALAVLAIALVGLRVALPGIVTSYANSRMAALGEYVGHVDDVDIALIRGAYVLRELRIDKRNVESETPFFEAPAIDLSLEWKALLSGRLTGELELHQPVLNLVQGREEKESQLGEGVSWTDTIRDLFPFDFNRVIANDGLVTFRAPGITTEHSITLAEAQLAIQNLANIARAEEDAFAGFALTGKVMGNAPITLRGRIDPTAEQPTFDVDLSLEGARLVDVNPWLREYMNVDAERGAFSMYTELAAADGKFEGYVKPILDDAEFFEMDEPSKNVLQKAWEGVVEIAAKLFENREEEQIATQVPLSGTIDEPDADVFAVIVNLLRNAFVAAFTHSIEGTVSLRDVESRENE